MFGHMLTQRFCGFLGVTLPMLVFPHLAVLSRIV